MALPVIVFVQPDRIRIVANRQIAVAAVVFMFNALFHNYYK